MLSGTSEASTELLSGRLGEVRENLVHGHPRRETL
jgi:hypothetical protein